MKTTKYSSGECKSVPGPGPGNVVRTSLPGNGRPARGKGK